MFLFYSLVSLVIPAGCVGVELVFTTSISFGGFYCFLDLDFCSFIRIASKPAFKVGWVGVEFTLSSTLRVLVLEDISIANFWIWILALSPGQRASVIQLEPFSSDCL
jgi:hypothetical protein